MKFYKAPWDKEKTETLIRDWPIYGTVEMAKRLNLKKSQIKSKADKLCLTMISKSKRPCFKCPTGFQSLRRFGNLCRKCHSGHRKEVRKNTPKSRPQWIKELLRTLRYRSKETCNLNLKYLLSLWDSQGGKCFYTGYDLIEPVWYGRGRNWNIASIDRVDSSKGYVRGNVVWCCWACNSGKSDFTVNKYLEICKIITDNQNNILNKIKNLQRI
jgi:hypothetical protein